MAIVFEPGQRYFVFTPERFAEMVAVYTELGFTFDLADDFELSADNYYCAPESYVSPLGPIDPEEYDFMESMGFSDALDYIRSTQSTYFFPPTPYSP